jgi:hypothetical protein
MSDDGSMFTDQEFEEYFGRDEPLPRERKLPRWARVTGILIAIVMFAGGIASLVNELVNRPDVREPIDIAEQSWSRVDDSPWGWLVDDIVVVTIDEPRVGAFVTNNPPNGVIQVDRRPWTVEKLDELMHHEMGHLMDFALWGSSSEGRRNGLASEAWAECAAVDAGTRRTDAQDPGGEYHCFEDELELFQEEIAQMGQICKTWGDLECRTLDE